MSAPDRIYLQDDGDFAEASLADLTWCADKINDADTGYVRADLFDALTAERDALRKAAATVLEGFEKGIFVRDAGSDHEPMWALRLLPYIDALAALTPSTEPLDPFSPEALHSAEADQ